MWNWLWLLAGCSPASGSPSDAPDETPWIDPAFSSLSARFTGSQRAVVWFEPQLIEPGATYAERAAERADQPRRELRAQVIRDLRALSETSYSAVRPALDRLEAEGLARGCRPYWIVNGFTCELTGADPTALAALPGVSRVFWRPPSPPRPEELGPRQVATSIPPAPPFDRRQPAVWNLERLRIPEVWRRFALAGEGVLVVIHDTGFRLDLPPVAGTLYRNPGEIPADGLDNEGDGYVDDVHGFAFDSVDGAINTPRVKPDRPLHGDAVAGIVAGRSPPGYPSALGGAPDARWAGVTGSQIEPAVEWALEHGADIYVMSFSEPDLGPFRAHWRKIMEHGALAGLFFVSGAGNFAREGSDNYAPVPIQMRTPEDIPLAVFGVAGIGPDGQRPAFSSQGPVVWDQPPYAEGTVDKPDLSTINAGVPVIGPDGAVFERTIDGNSLAGPHLAAVLALMLQADPDLTPWAARRILIETATDLGPPGFDYQTGFGLVDALRAVKETRRRERSAARPE